MSKLYYKLKGWAKNGLMEVVAVSERDYFGRKEILITPVAGSGEKWVCEDKLLKSVPNLEKKIVKTK